MSYLKYLVRIVSFASIFTIPGAVFASNPQHGISWLINGGLTAGGDKIALVQIASGNSSLDTVNIKAGELFFLSGGMIVDLPSSNFSVQTTIGWHTDSISASNGSVGFDRYPLEIIPFYQLGESHRLGAGVTYHLSPELDLADANGGTYEFENSLGFLLEYDYKFNNSAMLGLRYTFIDYEIDSIDGTNAVSTTDINGNHAGLVFGFEF